MENDVIDIQSAKERFMGNEALYKKFLFRFPDSTVMTELEQHLAENNIEDAFRDAHTMKGMVGNLSLYKLMNSASKVTESLRQGNRPEEEELEDLRETYRAAVNTVKAIMENDEALF